MSVCQFAHFPSFHCAFNFAQMLWWYSKWCEQKCTIIIKSFCSAECIFHSIINGDDQKIGFINMFDVEAKNYSLRKMNGRVCVCVCALSVFLYTSMLYQLTFILCHHFFGLVCLKKKTKNPIGSVTKHGAYVSLRRLHGNLFWNLAHTHARQPCVCECECVYFVYRRNKGANEHNTFETNVRCRNKRKVKDIFSLIFFHCCFVYSRSQSLIFDRIARARSVGVS